MRLETAVFDGVPFDGDVTCVIDAFFNFGGIDRLVFFEGYGNELVLGVHVDTLLEPFLVDEFQPAQLGSHADGTGGAAEPRT